MYIRKPHVSSNILQNAMMPAVLALKGKHVSVRLRIRLFGGGSWQGARLGSPQEVLGTAFAGHLRRFEVAAHAGSRSESEGDPGEDMGSL